MYIIGNEFRFFPAVARQTKSLIAEADLILDPAESRNAYFP
jgi:hypothetical protein